jgi:hypothetical protein
MWQEYNDELMNSTIQCSCEQRMVGDLVAFMTRSRRGFFGLCPLVSAIAAFGSYSH